MHTAQFFKSFETYILLLCLIGLTLLGVGALADGQNRIDEVIKGHVLSVELDYEEELADGQKQREQLVRIELEDGRVIETTNNIPEQMAFKVILEKGDAILVRESNGAYFIEGHYSAGVCWTLFITFTVLVLLIGGLKGLLALISLLAIGIFLNYLLIPQIINGVSPLLAASSFCSISAIITITLVSGWNLKTLAACCGTIFGVVIAGLLGAWAVDSAHLSGMLEPEFQSLHFQHQEIDIQELIAAGILIGALGAAMDVAISVASSTLEVYSAAPHLKMLSLFKSGMNVGKDVMGTMINTLILAYAGGAIATIILISGLSTSYLLNNEIIVKEIIMAFVGSIGLILTIPMTALVSSYLYTSFKTEIN